MVLETRQIGHMARWMDVLNALNGAGTSGISHSNGGDTYLGVGDTKHGVRETDGLGSQTDTSSGHSDVPSIKLDTLIPTIAPAIIRTTRKRGKLPNLPTQSTKWLPYKPNSHGNCLVRLDGWTDVQNSGNEMETPADEAETISICPIESKLPKSPTKCTNGCANETDGSSHHPGTLNMCTHVITPTDEVGNISMHPNEQKWPNSPVGSTRMAPDEPDSFGNPVDTSNGQTDAPSMQMDMLTSRNKPQTVRTPRNCSRPPNLPAEAAKQCSDEPDGCRDCVDMSGTHTDGHSITNNMKMAENVTEIIKTCPIKPTMQNSLNMAEIAMPRRSYQWRKVSAGSINIYAPSNAQIVPPS